MTDPSFAGKRNLALTDAVLLRRMRAFVAELGGLDTRVDVLEAAGTGGDTVTLYGGTPDPHPVGAVILYGGAP